MKKRILSFLLVSSIVLTSAAAPTLVFASDFDNKIEEKNQEISDLQNQQASIQSQVAALESDVAAINEKAQALLQQQGICVRILKS